MGAPEEVNVIYLVFIGTVTVFIFVTSIVAFFYLYQKKLYRKEQEMNAIVIRYQEELLYANWQVVEEERKRLSREFHDDIGSILSTLSLILGSLAENGPKADMNQVLAQSQQLIDSGIKNMRRILHDIVPPDIDIFGLCNVIVSLCERINSSQQIYITFQDRGIPLALFSDKQQELTLYRIIQELINNTLKHAKADKAELDLVWADEVLTLHYSDNGRGFDIEQLSVQGLGLRNIESRAKMINATISFTSSAEKGMNFYLNLPTSTLS